MNSYWPWWLGSLALASMTTLILLLVGTTLAWWLARSKAWWKELVGAVVAMPLVLPPTVLGYYLLSAFGSGSALGRAFTDVLGHPLAFSFAGLLAASLIFNLPFAIQPMQRAFEAIPADVRPAAACCGPGKGPARGWGLPDHVPGQGIRVPSSCRIQGNLFFPPGPCR